MEQSLEVGVPSKVKHPKTGDLLFYELEHFWDED